MLYPLSLSLPFDPIPTVYPNPVDAVSVHDPGAPTLKMEVRIYTFPLNKKLIIFSVFTEAKLNSSY